MKNANQIFKQFAVPKGLNFIEWIETEKSIYKERPRNVDFIVWLNDKYEKRGEEFFNASWKERFGKVTEILKENKDLIGTAASALGTSKAIKEESKEAEIKAVEDDKKKGFLGMPRPLAIGLGVVVLTGVGFGIYKLATRNKNK
jgi:hypothetical protein